MIETLAPGGLGVLDSMREGESGSAPTEVANNGSSTSPLDTDGLVQ